MSGFCFALINIKVKYKIMSVVTDGDRYSNKCKRCIINMSKGGEIINEHKKGTQFDLLIG